MRLPAPLRRAAPRIRTAVPADLRRFARAARSLRGGGPVTILPGFERVLVLAPHPDDESLGCGGTMALLSDRGASVSTLTATDGDATRGSSLPPEEIGRVRRAEAQRAAAAVGAEPRFLGLPDGALAEHPRELASGLRKTIAELEPDAIFAPWLLDGGSDHRAVATAVAEVLDGAGKRPEVWGYEVWTPLVPNRAIDITEVIERKRAAIACHETAAAALDLSAGEGLARWRSLQTLGGRGWVEAFVALDPVQYRELAAELAEPDSPQ
jgi:LmbE family N-acetylglucosaminyl deacetylase